MIFGEICDPTSFMEAYMDIELEITKEAEDKSEGFFESIWNKIVAFVKRVWEFFVKLFKRIINGFANILTFGKYKPFDINDAKPNSSDVEKIKAIKNSTINVPTEFFTACADDHAFIDPNKVAGCYLDRVVKGLVTYGTLTGKSTYVLPGFHLTAMQNFGKDLNAFYQQDLEGTLKKEEKYYNYYLSELKRTYTDTLSAKVESVINLDGLELNEDGYVTAVRKINDFISIIAKAIIDLKPIIEDKPHEYLDSIKTRLLHSVDIMGENCSEDEKNSIRSRINAWGLVMSRFLKEELAIFSEVLAVLNRLCDGLLKLIRKNKKK